MLRMDIYSNGVGINMWVNAEIIHSAVYIANIDCNMTTYIYGTLDKICLIDRYLKIVMSTTIPFELKIYSFNVWDKGLERTAKRLVGQTVSILFKYLLYNLPLEFIFLILTI